MFAIQAVGEILIYFGQGAIDIAGGEVCWEKTDGEEDTMNPLSLE